MEETNLTCVKTSRSFTGSTFVQTSQTPPNLNLSSVVRFRDEERERHADTQGAFINLTFRQLQFKQSLKVGFGASQQSRSFPPEFDLLKLT